MRPPRRAASAYTGETWTCPRRKGAYYCGMETLRARREGAVKSAQVREAQGRWMCRMCLVCLPVPVAA